MHLLDAAHRLTGRAALRAPDASRAAAGNSANEVLAKPVVIAWKDDQSGHSGPHIPGGASGHWHDYGEYYGETLELRVGDVPHFIFTETVEFEEPDLQLTSIEERDGTSILCVNDTCSDEDLRKIGHFADGGVG